jgi:MOSC domain-containing protein YiiM
MSIGVIREIHLAPRAREATHAVTAVQAIAGRGLEGDRYFAGIGSFSRWPDSGRAVSLIEWETIDATARETGIDLFEGRSRRNLVTAGVRLNDLVGKRFRIGGAMLRGSRLCAPCRYLERLIGPGLYDALKGRGGLRADIWESGPITVGDALTLL